MSIEKSQGFLSIPDLSFHGRYETSSDGCFDIAFDGSGHFVLLKGCEVLLQGNANAQIEACVSNSGTFLIGAVTSLDTLRSQLAAFDVSGAKLFSKGFNALLHRFGIAPSGRFAVCQTAMSEGGDASILTLLDLASAKEVWRITWAPWADSYEFDESRGELVLIYQIAGRFRFTFAGEFLDEKRWRVDKIRLLNGKELIAAVQDLIERGLTSSQAEDVLRSLEAVGSRTSETEWPKYAAAVKRASGEVFQALGRDTEALRSYALAIGLDPKVGAKKLYDALNKNAHEVMKEDRTQ